MSLTTVFDLDGTLVDSQNAVRCAYRLAGVEPPDDFWGRSADKWLPQLCDNSSGIVKLVHHAKQHYYRTLVNSGLVPLLPPANVLRRLQSVSIRTCVITAASRTSALDVLSYHMLSPNAIYFNSSGERRTYDLCVELNMSNVVILVDDRPRPDEPVPVIKYDQKMTTDELMMRIFELEMKEIMKRDSTWKP